MLHSAQVADAKAVPEKFEGLLTMVELSVYSEKSVCFITLYFPC